MAKEAGRTRILVRTGLSRVPLATIAAQKTDRRILTPAAGIAQLESGKKIDASGRRGARLDAAQSVSKCALPSGVRRRGRIRAPFRVSGRALLHTGRGHRVQSLSTPTSGPSGPPRNAATSRPHHVAAQPSTAALDMPVRQCRACRCGCGGRSTRAGPRARLPLPLRRCRWDVRSFETSDGVGHRGRRRALFVLE